MHESKFYKKLNSSQVQCHLCHQSCIINDTQKGLCGVRQNQKGTLYSLNYAKAIAEHIDPIEKKPFFHFLPGSTSLSVATVGCNFKCLHCQNADISQASKNNNLEIIGEELLPEQIVEHAVYNNCQSIAYTYTEPTIFYEYAYDTMKLAKEKNIKNAWVTNGYIQPEPLKQIAPLLDGANVDLKAFSEDFYKRICGAKLKPVLETLKLMKKLNIWVEVTTLIIPGLNDKTNELKKLAEFINNELGSETPWHISAFYPTYKLLEPGSTPSGTIHRASEIGSEAGLKYVYSGNLPGDNQENTFCPKCNELNIKRTGYTVERFDENGKCRKCGKALDIIDNHLKMIYK